MNSIELKNRTKTFAHQCVKLAHLLPNNVTGKHLAGQLIRSSTSVAANYRAACLAQSKKTFAAKISIALEEADESHFWIEFISDEQILENSKIENLMKEALELTRILAASRKTAQIK